MEKPREIDPLAFPYNGEKWIWEFTVPDGAVAEVTLPDETIAKEYKPGTYKVIKDWAETSSANNSD